MFGALGGNWPVRQAQKESSANWVVVESDSGRLFNAFHRAMISFGIDSAEPEDSFPNLRLVYVNERFAPSFFDAGSIANAHVHLPRPTRFTRPEREALVTSRFVADLSDVMEAFGGGRSLFRKHRNVKGNFAWVRTAGFRRVLGRFSAESRQIGERNHWCQSAARREQQTNPRKLKKRQENENEQLTNSWLMLA